MDRKKRNVPDLKRSLSSLTSQITHWSASRSCSPSRKKGNKCSSVDVRDLQGHNLSADLTTGGFNTIPWYEKYSPKNVNEVSIHKKKSKEVRDELEAMMQGRSEKRVLLLTGPSGCCKSTIVNMLAKELVPKYRAAGGRGENVIRYENDMAPNGASHIGSFGQFLGEAKYRVVSNLSLILVEDIPNVFHAETRSAFRRQLLEWLYMPKRSLPPLVICLTECELENDNGSFIAYGVDYSWTAESILGKEILSHACLKRIKFNPVNATLMRKTLVNICNDNKAELMLREKWDDKDRVIEGVIQSTGDLRSGIAMLQFWATSTGCTATFARDSSTSYFHAIGKVLHGSRDVADDSKMINELLLNSMGHLSHDNFSLGLLENYASFNKGKFSILEACKLTDSLSESNTMDMTPESLEFCLRKVRHIFGEMGQGSHSHGRAKFPREWKISQAQSEFLIQCEDYTNVSVYKYGEPRLFRNIALQFGFYDPEIKSIRFYKEKALKHYRAKLSNDAVFEVKKQRIQSLEVDPTLDITARIGGDINLIDGHDTEISEDDHQSGAKEALDRLRRTRDAKLQKLLELYGTDSELKAGTETDDEQFEEDPIIDSDQDVGAVANNTLDDEDSIYEALSQKPRNLNGEKPVSESLSDSDLEDL
ncbi:hypothetical protein HG536_0H02980 [Torulaspora globosa]|uniref:Checkpoint protein RAD24-like helical bundle domain-containing protein n=1 Tax=Torulaspora globosa TaxID=48254 RepID=A0A7G3ZN37_9SACH|nr:uncharacterized protein HG536_0H02980 [Torulaspora globosa]QLL34923.1 hypothetical protein HG536_0H02980 [Torulaspora globosa]